MAQATEAHRWPRRFGLSLASLAGPAFCGCASYGSHLTATPTPAGGRELAVHADAVVERPSTGTGAQTRPQAELGYRWGLGDHVDIGVRGHGMGGEVNSRLRLLASDGINLTASPFLGGGLIPNHQDNAGALRFPAGLRALVGWQASAGLEVTVGAVGTFEAQAAMQHDTQRSQLLVAPGALLSTQFPLRETLRINLEVNAHVPYGLEGGAWQAPVVQGGAAVKWLTF